MNSLITQTSKENNYEGIKTKNSSKMDQRHRSSEPKDKGKAENGYDKESIDFHILSPQPQRKGLLPRVHRMRDRGKKTLILDLDETLVHSSFEKWKWDIELPISMDNQNHTVYVNIRPRAIDFLRKITKYYEVAIFTASVANYADPLIETLDTNKYGFYKLFREDWTYNGNYTKDLSRLGRDLKDCIIVDNLAKSYANQPENGIPILSWYDDPNDKELDLMFPLLIMLSKMRDVRKYVKRMVKKDKIDYNIINSLFKNKPEFKEILKKISVIKNYKKSPKKDNKENRQMASNNREEKPLKK